MFARVLVANRGEIALRVMRTCRDLGVESVAVFTAADAGAPHVRGADRAVPIGDYLSVDEVVAAAVASGAQAVHPGYGFLSERASFARAVTAAGLVFVGPSASVVDLMGRKDAAREVAVAAGVPVVPAYAVDDDPAGWAFPVLVKAAAGGGGKGMRVVRTAADLPEALAAARREAAAAFGDDTMLVERYVERGRHVEVQVLGDDHGRVVHLGTRDCSAQRRHQKVVEEAPAPDLPPGARSGLPRAAVDLARRVGYAGAGTVEFLLDADSGDWFFLEMNTRLQVEHPVTEAVAGVDLVAEQLRVAAGEPLGVGDLAEPVGHAIEVRVYAEDAYAGYLPQAGTAGVVRWPAGAGIRVEQALESGQAVGTAYDPMLAKVIAHGPDRETARRRLVAALDRTAVLGLTTNLGFLRTLVAGPAFARGPVDTAWLDREPPAPPDAHLAGVVAAWATAPGRSPGAGPWGCDGWRLGGPPAPVRSALDRVRLVDRAAGTVTVDGRSHRVGELGAEDGWRLLDVDGERVRALVSAGARAVEVSVGGQRFVLARPDPAAASSAADPGRLTAPMPGTMTAVDVAVGERVVAGQRLGVLEAMKMELAVRAPVAGRVTAVGASVGGRVALGERLFVVEEE